MKKKTTKKKVEINGIIIKCSYSELIPTSQLIEHPDNSNKHPEKQIKLLSKLIKYQGYRHPIIISNLSGYIVAGHGRLECAKNLGMDSVPVDYQDFDNKAQEMAFLESDNLSADLAEHDTGMMIDNIKGLGLPDDFDLELFGVPDLELTEFEPASIDEQGQLDEVKIKIMECPSCGETFEEKQAKIID